MHSNPQFGTYAESTWSGDCIAFWGCNTRARHCSSTSPSSSQNTPLLTSDPSLSSSSLFGYSILEELMSPVLLSGSLLPKTEPAACKRVCTRRAGGVSSPARGHANADPCCCVPVTPVILCSLLTTLPVLGPAANIIQKEGTFPARSWTGALRGGGPRHDTRGARGKLTGWTSHPGSGSHGHYPAREVSASSVRCKVLQAGCGEVRCGGAAASRSVLVSRARNCRTASPVFYKTRATGLNYRLAF